MSGHFLDARRTLDRKKIQPNTPRQSHPWPAKTKLATCAKKIQKKPNQGHGERLKNQERQTPLANKQHTKTRSS
ncbi:hypothetical protein CR970_00110 [Candidatus Saccharibacteria bacterium]|nr:MAG: hypothetical protein CR970_00110 [Candidatus Saccharibacteria bacterium]